jgi:glutamate 5-kinase
MAKDRKQLKSCRRCVVKIGSALLTGDGAGLNTAGINQWVMALANMRKAGIEVVLVTSGSVAAGMQCLGISERPHALHELQAMAAVGQMDLIRTYELAFQKYELHTAQILLTHDDLADRTRYLNARSTLRELLRYQVVPVVNENDTVATEEIRFGDNDTLAALVANLIEADLLIIRTDQEGLFDKDPRTNKDAKLIEQASAGDVSLQAMAGDSGALGRGGMRTKLLAAEKAARSGTATVIASGLIDKVLGRILKGECIGTFLQPDRERLAARKQWLAGQMQAKGKVVIDVGAVKVLRESGRSLLPVGVKAIEGNFDRGEIVLCVGEDGEEVARGLVNYSAEESSKIMGHPSTEIERILGYIDEPELVHRDNMVVL